MQLLVFNIVSGLEDHPVVEMRNELIFEPQCPVHCNWNKEIYKAFYRVFEPTGPFTFIEWLANRLICLTGLYLDYYQSQKNKPNHHSKSCYYHIYKQSVIIRYTLWVMITIRVIYDLSSHLFGVVKAKKPLLGFSVNILWMAPWLFQCRRWQ